MLAGLDVSDQRIHVVGVDRTPSSLGDQVRTDPHPKVRWFVTAEMKERGGNGGSDFVCELGNSFARARRRRGEARRNPWRVAGIRKTERSGKGRQPAPQAGDHESLSATRLPEFRV